MAKDRTRRSVAKVQAEALAWARENRLLMPGDTKVQHMRRLSAYRVALDEQIEPAYRTVVRREAAAPAEVEVLF